MTENMIEKAEQTAKRLEEANKKMEEHIKKLEELGAKKLLSGQAEAGVPSPELSKEEKLKQDMKKYFKGGMLEGFIK